MNKFLSCLVIACVLVGFSGCKKTEPKPPECEVKQFGAPTRSFVDGAFVTIPYLFSKTFDKNGKVQTIDAYLFSVAPGHRVKATLKYEGQMTYLFNTDNAKDTVMILWMDSNGRVAKAEERSTLSANSTQLYRYEYTYNSQNKLLKYRISSVSGANPSYTDSCTYDNAGNVVLFGGTAYEYDLTKTTRKSFYMDVENYSSDARGTRFLSYLGYFPELTSPSNLRIVSRTIRFNGPPVSYYMNYALGNHKLDNQGKLVYYEHGFTSTQVEPYPIVWNCDETQAMP